MIKMIASLILLMIGITIAFIQRRISKTNELLYIIGKLMICLSAAVWSIHCAITMGNMFSNVLNSSFITAFTMCVIMFPNGKILMRLYQAVVGKQFSNIQNIKDSIINMPDDKPENRGKRK